MEQAVTGCAFAGCERPPRKAVVVMLPEHLGQFRVLATDQRRREVLCCEPHAEAMALLFGAPLELALAFMPTLEQRGGAAIPTFVRLAQSLPSAGTPAERERSH